MTNGTYPDVPEGRGHQLAPSQQRQELQRLTQLATTAPSRPEDEDVIDLRQYWSVLLRRKGTVLTVLAMAVVAAVLITSLSTPIFRASALLQIDLEDGRVLEYQDVTATESGGWSSKDFYETQYELLQSRSLASRVIDRLGLRAAHTQAEGEETSFFAEIVGTLTGWMADGHSDASDERRPPDLESIFLAGLTIQPVKNSRLVRVSYDSPDPEDAAAAANAVAESFVALNLERRYDAHTYARKFLEEQTEQIRANLEDSERRLVDYAREREIINLEDKEEILMNKLKEMNAQLIQAEAERILAEAEYNEMIEEGTASVVNVLDSPVIQKLKERKADLEAEYQEKLKIYKPGYPKMQQLRQRIAEVAQEISNESAFIANSVKTNFESKVRREAKINQRINEIKEEILALQDRSTDYQTLKREVETNRELYDGLLQRMKEVGVAAGIGTNNISVVDVAEVPRGAYKPSLVQNLAIALALGLFGGVLLAFLFETLDDTVKNGEQLEKLVGAPVLGIVPVAAADDHAAEDHELPLLVARNPKSTLAEAYRSLRTSLIFATSEGAPKALHVTSSGPGEGKTTTAVGTAITFAQTGNRVLLIDADLRNPSIHQVFLLPNTAGLTNYLAGDAKPVEIAQPTEVTRLFAVTSGPLPPNPVELLSSAKMLDFLSLARERFDYVIIDGPPIIGLADALVLANLAGSSLLVVEAAATRAGALEGSVKRLQGANARILGCVFAKVGRGGSRYGYGYGYGYGYDYHYSYGGSGGQTALPRHS